MASSIAKVSSAALTELQSDLTRLSSTLHEIYELMNADMRQVNVAWQDAKYQEFVQNYQPQIQKCEDVSKRYSEWCKRVLDPSIENVTAIEMTDVSSGSSVGGVSVGALGGAATATAVGGAAIAEGFFMGTGNVPKATTKAVPISNGCGSETDPSSFVFATAGRALDTKLQTVGRPWKEAEEWKAQEESCDIHDKCYYKGEGKEKCDIEFQQRSPIMGTAVRMAKETSNKSYEEAQKDRLLSEQLQSTWEEEHRQSLDAENYRVIPNE